MPGDIGKSPDGNDILIVNRVPFTFITHSAVTVSTFWWTNMDKHEMYCAGHMIEAGVAYYQATGKRKLLDVCIRMTDHMMSQFGPGVHVPPAANKRNPDISALGWFDKA